MVTKFFVSRLSSTRFSIQIEHTRFTIVTGVRFIYFGYVQLIDCLQWFSLWLLISLLIQLIPFTSVIWSSFIQFVAFGSFQWFDLSLFTPLYFSIAFHSRLWFGLPLLTFLNFSFALFDLSPITRFYRSIFAFHNDAIYLDFSNCLEIFPKRYLRSFAESTGRFT